MLIIFAIPILLAFVQLGNFNFEWLNDGLGQLQSLCAQGYHLSRQHEVISAMVCGQSPATQQVLTEWSRAGLLPVFIGAGTHFIFLEQILNRLLHRHPTLRKTSLFLFVCVTGFSPALTRGLAAQFFSDLNQKWKLGLSFSKIWATTILCCLIVCPHWISSLGFLISAQCGLLMYLTYKVRTSPGQPKSRSRYVGPFFRGFIFAILRSALFMLGLMPLFKILGLPVLHPYAALIQLIGTPVAGLILFPIGVLERLIQPLQIPLDPFWNLIAQLIHRAAELVSPMNTAPFQKMQNGQLFWAWSYVGSFFACVSLLDLIRRNRTHLAIMGNGDSHLSQVFPTKGRV